MLKTSSGFLNKPGKGIIVFIYFQIESFNKYHLNTQ